MTIRAIRVPIAVLLLALFAVTAFAATVSPVSEKQRLNSIVDRMLRNEPVSPAEKAEAYTLYLERERAASAGSNAIDAQGGPDGFGYKYIDNNGEASGPVYSWIDISTTGTNVGVSGDDATSAALPIGFTFNYYGTAYTTFKACTNGWISLDAATTSTAYTNSTIPGAGTPNTLIAPFWDDQLVSAVGNFKYQSFGTYLVVSWTTTSYSGGSGTFNYQAILYADGTIRYQYNTLGTSLASATIGIENSTGTIGLLYNYNSGAVNPAAAGRAVLFYTLSAPTYTSPANGATGVVTNTQLVWNDASGATGYDVLLDPFTPPTTVVSSNQAGTTYQTTGLLPSTLYYWQIIARSGTSTAAGPIWSFTTGAGAAPNAPSFGNITGITADGMTFNWTDNSNDELGFNLYFSTDGVTYSAPVSVPPNTTSAPVTGIGPNAGRWFRVSAFNAGGESGITNANAYTYANAPQVPTVGSPTFSSLTVTPADAMIPNPASTAFAIHEMTTNQYVQGSGALGASAAWNTLAGWGAKVVTGLAGATTYTFEVKAKNGDNIETAFSANASGTTTNWSVNPNVFTSNVAIPIQDNVTNTGTLVVSDTRLITDMDVQVNGTHTWVSDVDMYLNSPGATRIRLFPMGTGGSSDNWVNMIFNDEAPTSITTGAAPFTGEWQPASPLSGFDNQPANGTWTFETYDNYGGDTGQITSWSMAMGLANPTLPIIGFSPNALAFGDVVLGTTSTTQGSTVSNLGAGTLNISSVVSPTEVSTTYTGMTIAAGANAPLTATWTPTVSGPFTGNIVFTSDASNGPTNNLAVSGNAVALLVSNPTANPASGLAGDNFTFTVDVSKQSPLITIDNVDLVTTNGATVTTAMTAISGSFPGTVTYSATLPLTMVGGSTYRFTVYYTEGAVQTPVAYPTGGASIAGPNVLPAQTGGPDGAGYYFRTNNAPSGPAFSWVDISTTGTQLPAFGNYDDAVQLIPMGTFTFPFYGTNWTGDASLWASTNGNLQFGVSAMTNYSNGTLPTASLNTEAMPFFWDDMQVDLAASQWVKYQNMLDGRFVVSYHFSNLGNAVAGTFDAQVIMYNTGRVIYQYNNVPVGLGGSGTTGIQGTGGSLMFGGTTNVPVSGIAIEFYRNMGPGPFAYTAPANGANDQSTAPTLSWDASASATGYDVYFGVGNPPVATVATNTAATSYTFGAGALLPNTTYYWSVTALNGSGSNAGPVWSFTTAAVPDAPVASITYAGGNATITWPTPAGLISQYNVYRSNSAYFTPTGANYIGSVPVGTNLYTDVGVSGYNFYKITAVNAASTSVAPRTTKRAGNAVEAAR